MSGAAPGGQNSALAARTDVEDYIVRVQRDGRLLLRFVARRSDRALSPHTPTGVARDGMPSDALFADVSTVLASPDKLAELMNCVDDLSRRAAPANVRSIRLTSAYLRIAVEGGEPPEDIKKEARNVRLYMAGVTFVSVLFLFISIGLLAHMDNGRRILQQLDLMRQQEQDIQRDILALPLEESLARSIDNPKARSGALAKQDPAIPLTADQRKTLEQLDKLANGAQVCGKPVDIEKINETDPPIIYWREPITQKASAICRRSDDINIRLALLYTGLADWNCLSHKIFTFKFLVVGFWSTTAAETCGAPTVELPPAITLTTWRSHESWVSGTTSVVAGFILPLLLGSLGGCAYALRRIDTKLSTWTVEPHDGRHALSRVALAALLGGLVGVVWTSGDNVTLGGFTLSLAAAAFFIGFSVEGVFKVIENLIINVTATVGNPAPSLPVVTPITSIVNSNRNPPPQPPPRPPSAGDVTKPVL